MNTKEKIEVMQAFLDGAALEIKYENGEWYPWTLGDEPQWSWDTNEFRVKPMPMVVWVNVYDDGGLFIHETEASALNDAGESADRIAVKFMEVME